MKRQEPDDRGSCSAKLACSNIAFEDDEHTTGVCVLEDTSVMTEFGYQLLQRYQVTLDRLTYD